MLGAGESADLRRREDILLKKPLWPDTRGGVRSGQADVVSFACRCESLKGSVGKQSQCRVRVDDVGTSVARKQSTVGGLEKKVLGNVTKSWNEK